jgi:hypothetical protein
MSNALTVYQDGGFEIMRQTAGVFSRSKFFENAEDEAKAMVKIMAGAELGIQPFAAMTGIHVIKGKPALGANIIAALIKSSGRYNYRVVEHTEAVCRIQFFEKVNGSWEKIGISDYTSQEAQRAGVQNMQKFPKNMLFARAISNGARWHCPDIFAGAPVYTADELGVQVDEDGVIVESTYTEAPAPRAPWYTKAPDDKTGFRNFIMANVPHLSDKILAGDAILAALSGADFTTVDKSELAKTVSQWQPTPKPLPESEPDIDFETGELIPAPALAGAFAT